MLISTFSGRALRRWRSAYDHDTAQLAREHNDANIVSLGGRMHTPEDALELVRIFLETPFSKGERHARRIAMLARYEETGSLA